MAISDQIKDLTNSASCGISVPKGVDCPSNLKGIPEQNSGTNTIEPLESIKEALEYGWNWVVPAVMDYVRLSSEGDKPDGPVISWLEGSRMKAGQSLYYHCIEPKIHEIFYSEMFGENPTWKQICEAAVAFDPNQHVKGVGILIFFRAPSNIQEFGPQGEYCQEIVKFSDITSEFIYELLYASLPLDFDVNKHLPEDHPFFKVFFIPVVTIPVEVQEGVRISEENSKSLERAYKIATISFLEEMVLTKDVSNPPSIFEQAGLVEGKIDRKPIDKRVSLAFEDFTDNTTRTDIKYESYLKCLIQGIEIRLYEVQGKRFFVPAKKGPIGQRRSFTIPPHNSIFPLFLEKGVRAPMNKDVVPRGVGKLYETSLMDRTIGGLRFETEKVNQKRKGSKDRETSQFYHSYKQSTTIPNFVKEQLDDIDRLYVHARFFRDDHDYVPVNMEEPLEGDEVKTTELDGRQ
ncbi:hypothetical protein JCM3765_006689 [Sporobolomyces pararoseus]